MDELFISAYRESATTFSINVETLVVLFVYLVTNEERVKLFMRLETEKPSETLVAFNFANINFTLSSNVPEISLYCAWPVIISEKRIIAGVCSVARKLIKNSSRKEIRHLLGFREACLMACSESSIWTRFCEVDIIATTKNMIKNDFYGKDGVYFLPEDVARFEYHLSKPVRMHNIYKAARAQNNDKAISSSVPVGELNLKHSYSEGTLMTLADIILFPCFKIFFQTCPLELVKEVLPLTHDWYEQMKRADLPDLIIELPRLLPAINEVRVPNVVKQSLYTSDPARYRPEKRIHTKQNDIETAFELIARIKNVISNAYLPFGNEIPFSWVDIPHIVNPNGGALPKKRAGRKCEQLENLARAVVKLAAGKQYKIVDFCSGSGHLGILLAVLLPSCEIILVENKEQSLARAKVRIDELSLRNILVVQSNLDYFRGNFDLGVALHACGVATDLVIKNCVEKSALFVVCPCCYGGVKDCQHLTYPRSERFRNLGLDYKSYLCLAHAADQTHELENVKTMQGYFCMDVVDTDRRLYAESFGYKVHLGKLQPTTCTNKNNLLVGVREEKDETSLL